jgi:hypothetical protein
MERGMIETDRAGSYSSTSKHHASSLQVPTIQFRLVLQSTLQAHEITMAGLDDFEENSGAGSPEEPLIEDYDNQGSAKGKGGRATVNLPMNPGGKSPPNQEPKNAGFTFSDGKQVTYSDLDSDEFNSDVDDVAAGDKDYPTIKSYEETGGHAMLKTVPFPYNKKSNPVGIFVNREENRVPMKAYTFKETGDMYRLNEVDNTHAQVILSAVTKRYRQLVQENSKCRTPMQAIRDVISAYTDSVVVTHKNLDLRNEPITDRVTKTFFKILAGYNTENDEGLTGDELGNMQLRRIGYVYAHIRLGTVGYRHQADRYMAASLAIRNYVQWFTKGNHDVLRLWFVPIYNLFKGHTDHHKTFELPNHPLGMNETDMPKPYRNKKSTVDSINETVWQDELSRKTNNGKWWFKERDSNQINHLEDYIRIYEENESYYFPEVSCLVLSEEAAAEKHAAQSVLKTTKRKKRKSTDALHKAPKPIG